MGLTIRCSVRKICLGPLALLIAASPALGQHTQVSDAGGGRKVEVIYDAGNQVVESRTLAPDGHLQQRVEFERRPGFQVPQQTTTSYWPDGKTIHTQSRVEYDANANFLSQTDALFDRSGKETAGNKLTHDPLTGVYRCYLWNPETSGYRPEACPKGEEEPREDEEREMTRAEVMKDLAEARRKLRSEEKLRRLAPKPPVRPPITSAEREAGVVLPASLRPNERVSGSVTEEPARYEGVPGLQVVRLKVPFESQGEAATLGGWTFLAAKAGPQRADGPVTFVVPRASGELKLTLQQTGNPAHEVSASAPVERGGAAAGSGGAFESSPLCFTDQLCPVRGNFSGDSTRALAAFGNQPAPIVAETTRAAYIAVPGDLPPDFYHLLVAGGARAAAWPVTVAQFELTPLGRELQQGQTLVMHAIIEGAHDLPNDAWRAGTFAPLATLDRAHRVAPGFDPSKYGANGVILAVVQNHSSDGVTMRGAKDQAYVFGLTRDSFERGEFKYNFVLEFARSGGYSLRAIALPFLAPVKGRVFSVSSESQAPGSH